MPSNDHPPWGFCPECGQKCRFIRKPRTSQEKAYYCKKHGYYGPHEAVSLSEWEDHFDPPEEPREQMDTTAWKLERGPL